VSAWVKSDSSAATSPRKDGRRCAMASYSRPRRTLLSSHCFGMTYGGDGRVRPTSMGLLSIFRLSSPSLPLQSQLRSPAPDHIRHAGCNGTRKVLPPAPEYMTARLSALRTDKMKTCASRASKVRRTRPDSVRLRAIGIASSVLPPFSTVPRHRERLSSWQSVAALARG